MKAPLEDCEAMLEPDSDPELELELELLSDVELV